MRKLATIVLFVSFAMYSSAQTAIDPGRINWTLNPSTTAKAATVQASTLAGTFAVRPWFDVTNPAYGAKGGASINYDAVTVNGSKTLTSASANFPCAAINAAGGTWIIQIQNAGASGVPQLNTIASCQSGNSITLGIAAGNSASGQIFFWGPYDDSAAFIAAQAAAAASGGTIVVPTGVYIVSANPVVSFGAQNPVTWKGTCSFFGSRIIAIATAAPAAMCSTVLDGSNNNTFQFLDAANNFAIKNIDFFSFPNSSGSFIYLSGRANGTAEIWNGLIESNGFWGKQYNVYGQYILENISIKDNASGCAGSASIYLSQNLGTTGSNKLHLENNYIDMQGTCTALPTSGIYLGSTNTMSGVVVRRNEVQNLANANAVAIDVDNCSSCEISANDLEQITGSNGVGLKLALNPGVVGPNSIYNAKHPMTFYGGGTHIASQYLANGAATVAPSINVTGGAGGNTVDCQVQLGTLQDVIDTNTNDSVCELYSGGTSNSVLQGSGVTFQGFQGSADNFWMGMPQWGSHAFYIFGPNGTTGNEQAAYYNGLTHSWTFPSSGGMTVTGPFKSEGGSNIVYRCSGAGTLRLGQLTTVSTDCGTAVDTGIRVP